MRDHFACQPIDSMSALDSRALLVHQVGRIRSLLPYPHDHI